MMVGKGWRRDLAHNVGPSAPTGCLEQAEARRQQCRVQQQHRWLPVLGWQGWVVAGVGILFQLHEQMG